VHGEVSQDQSLCAASPDARLEGIRVEEIPSKADVHVEDNFERDLVAKTSEQAKVDEGRRRSKTQVLRSLK